MDCAVHFKYKIVLIEINTVLFSLIDLYFHSFLLYVHWAFPFTSYGPLLSFIPFRCALSFPPSLLCQGSKLYSSISWSPSPHFSHVGSNFHSSVWEVDRYFPNYFFVKGRSFILLSEMFLDAPFHVSVHGRLFILSCWASCWEIPGVNFYFCVRVGVVTSTGHPMRMGFFCCCYCHDHLFVRV